MILRPATPGDAPACAVIVRDWIEATAWMPGGPSRAELEAILREGFAPSSGREVWVAGEVPQGYLSFDPAEGRVVGLYTATPGQGIGRALMDRVKAGRDALWLRSHQPNVAAHRFYERESFATTARDLPGDDGVPEIRMDWSA